VLVEMRAVGINPLDNTFRSGHIYLSTPENLPRIGGQSGVGVVLETHSADFKAGDRVFVKGPGWPTLSWNQLHKCALFIRHFLSQ